MDLSALAQLHFLHPKWLAAVPPVLALLLWLRWRQSRSGGWARVMDPALVDVLRLEAGGGSGGPWLLLAMLATFSFVALAAPAWERLPSLGFRAPEDWIAVLDLSPSMSVADVAPDRATRARFAIDDLLGAAHDVRIALVAFAGEPHTVVPLTSDVATIRGLLPSLSPALMPEHGDALGPALAQAGQLLRQSASRHAVIIAFTDGSADPAAAMESARQLAAQGATVEVVGVGTAGGAPLKGDNGEFLHDEQGRSRLARLPVEELQRIAVSGHGHYWTIAQVPQLIEMLGERRANPLDEKTVATDRQVAAWRNGGIWLLPPILLFALLIARRGWV